MYKDDSIRVYHMLDAAKEAVAFTHRKTRKTLSKDRMLALSLVRLIEIIGEAASQVTREFQEKHPEIPWTQIIAMRNRLIHAYFDIDLDRIWDTVKNDLPSLIIKLQKLASSFPKENF